MLSCCVFTEKTAALDTVFILAGLAKHLSLCLEKFLGFEIDGGSEFRGEDPRFWRYG